MTSTLPVLNRNFDALADELVIMAKPHRNILNVQNNQWWTIDLTDWRSCTFTWNSWWPRLASCIQVRQVDRNLCVLSFALFWCVNLPIIATLVFPVTVRVVVVPPSFRSAAIVFATAVLQLPLIDGLLDLWTRLISNLASWPFASLCLMRLIGQDWSANVIVRVHIDQLGQLQLSLASRYLVDLRRRCNQCGHVYGLDLRPNVRFETQMLGAQQPAVHINQEKAGRFLRVALTLKEFDLVIDN